MHIFLSTSRSVPQISVANFLLADQHPQPELCCVELQVAMSLIFSQAQFSQLIVWNTKQENGQADAAVSAKEDGGGQAAAPT